MPERMHSHIGCICSTFLHCAFPNVSSSHLPPRMKSHTGCICLTFPHCAFSNASSYCLPERMQSHTGCICLIFFTVHLQVSLQIACHRGWIGYIRLTSFHHFSLLLEHFHQHCFLLIDSFQNLIYHHLTIGASFDMVDG